MIIKRQNMSENKWNHFKIVPQGHNNCQLSIVNCQFGEATKFQFVSVLTKTDNLLPPGCQRKKGAKKPRQSSPRFRLRPAAIPKIERLLQNGAPTKGSHPRLFFAPYSVSWQQPHEQTFEISFLARNADGIETSIIPKEQFVNREQRKSSGPLADRWFRFIFCRVRVP